MAKTSYAWIVVIIVILLAAGFIVLKYFGKPTGATVDAGSDKTYADIPSSYPQIMSPESCQVSCTKSCTDAGYDGFSGSYQYEPRIKCLCNCYKE